jgi:hypothetical protein
MKNILFKQKKNNDKINRILWDLNFVACLENAVNFLVTYTHIYIYIIFKGVLLRVFTYANAGQLSIRETLRTEIEYCQKYTKCICNQHHKPDIHAAYIYIYIIHTTQEYTYSDLSFP